MRNIVSGLFERAKSWWLVGFWSKVAVAIAGFVLSADPAAALGVGIAVLCLEGLATAAFYFADGLKSKAEPILTRLDYEGALGWSIPKELTDEYRADYSKYEALGQKVRQNDPYFATPPTETGVETLVANIMESAFYTRSIAKSAANVCYFLLSVTAVAFFSVLLTAVYRDVFRARHEFYEYAVDALILLVTIDLAPRARQYLALSGEAGRARDILPRAKTIEEVIPAVVEYQLARASAPLLPTFTFLKGRTPLAAIWTGSAGKH